MLLTLLTYSADVRSLTAVRSFVRAQGTATRKRHTTLHTHERSLAFR